MAPGRLELVEPEPGPQPLVPVPAPAAPARARPWRRLLVWSGGLFLVGLLGLQAHDLLVELFDRSVWLGGAAALLLAGVAAGALGDRSAARPSGSPAWPRSSISATTASAC